MVVVHPDDVVRLQDLGQLVGEVPVDAEIAGEVAAVELGEIDPVVQDRPQHPVGEAVVIFLVVLLGQVGDDEAPLRGLDLARGDLACRDNIAAPAEPHRLRMLPDRRERDLKPARALAVRARRRDTIGDEDQPRQYRSSQLRESRIAVRIRPAME